MDKTDLKLLFKNLNKIKLFWVVVKKGHKIRKKIKKICQKKLGCKKFLQKGHIIKSQDIICKRPGTGIAPKFLTKIKNKRIIKNLKRMRL